MSRKIKIAIVDDHTLFRKGVSGLIEESDELELVLEAADGREFLDALEKMNPEFLPEVVLMDLQMPGMDGFDTTRIIAEKHPEIKVLALSMHNTEQVVMHVMDCGASGFLAKDAEFEALVKAIRQVYTQGIFLCARTTEILRKRMLAKTGKYPSNEILSEKELSIIKMICDQKNAREIGEALDLSPRTIESHKASILRKTGAKNTAGIVMFALRNNLITKVF